MWWMSKAMVRCQRRLDEHNEGLKPEFHVHMVAQIHDELLFDFPKAAKSPTEVTDWKADKFNYLRSNLPLVRELKALMEQGGDDIGVPTPVNVEYHPVCWAEGIGV